MKHLEQCKPVLPILAVRALWARMLRSLVLWRPLWDCLLLLTLLRWCILGWEGVGTSTQIWMTLYFSALHAFLLQHYNRHPYSRVSWWPYRWFLRYRAQRSYRSHIHQYRDTLYTTKLLREKHIWHSWVHVSLFLILRDIYTWLGVERVWKIKYWLGIQKNSSTGRFGFGSM